MFSDLVGSTELGERLDPEALRELLAGYFAEMRAVVERHGGRIERLLGDAVIAVFGFPVAGEDDALRAVRAAVEMRAALVDVSARLPAGLDLQIGARTGVNTGEVLTAEDGLSGSVSGGVVGDAINVAARLEGVAQAGEILLGELTQRLVRDHVRSEPLTLRLKGKREVVTAHRLLGMVAASVPRRPFSAPLIGRGRERDELLATFERVRAAAAPQLVTVLGEAGAGKSRLVREATSSMKAAATIPTGRCLPYGEATMMLPLAEIACELAGITLDTELERARDALAHLLMSEPDRGTLERAARLTGALGIGPLAGAIEEAAPDIAALLAAAARRGPLVAVIEDLHWAKSLLLDLLAEIIRSLDDAAVLLLCTAREELRELHAGWFSPSPQTAVVTIDALSEGDGRELIAALLGQSEASRLLVEPVLAVAEGNPLIVEEALAMLVDDGVLRRERDGWRLERAIEAIRIPPTVDAILAARLDRLPERERAAVELAAIVGKEFTRAELAALDPAQTGDQLDQVIDALWRKQLIDVDERPPGSFRFHHILVRDAAYTSTPKRRRAELHHRYADVLESSPGGERGGQFGEIVGEHLERAWRLWQELGAHTSELTELGRRAADRLADAGQRAFGISEFPPAERLQRRALELIDSSDPRRLSLLVDLGDTLSDLGRHADARPVLAEAIAVAERTGDIETRLQAALLLARSEIMGGQRDAADALEDMRLDAERLEALTDDRSVIRAWMALGHVAHTASRLADGFAMTKRALAHARRLGGAELPYCLAALSEMALYGPLPVTEARRECEAALAEAQPGTLHAVMIEMKLGAVYALEGDFDAARAAINPAVVIGEAHHADMWVASALFELGRCELFAGDLDKAECWFAQTRERLNGADDPFYSVAVGMHARALAMLGRLEDAHEAARIAEANANGVESTIQYRIADALVSSALGEHAQAAATARAAVELSEMMDEPLIRGDAALTLGEVLQAEGRRAEAAAAFEAALAVYERKGILPAVARTRALLHEVTAPAR